MWHWRDKADSNGIEAALSLWLPEKTPAKVIERLRSQIAVTFTNYFTMAYGDLTSGRVKAAQ